MEHLALILSAAPEAGGSIDWAETAMGLVGGLALFLFGMDRMSDALKSALGSSMKHVLGVSRWPRLNTSTRRPSRAFGLTRSHDGPPPEATRPWWLGSTIRRRYAN